MRRVFLVMVWLFAGFGGSCQYFNTGEDPASLRWRQIVTPDFQLIYPADFEAKAREMAAFFTKVYDVGGATLHHRPRPVSVIFHTRTVRSNGLVGWAPRRMELFTPPHQDIYAQEWLQQLVLHEFRHVVQVDKIQSQMPGLIRALLGEQGAALITGMYLPFWFIEGDAVVSETALSHAGRGRYPSFLMEHRAQVIEKGIFTFDKAFNGSFRDYVPDHYKLGWYLVAGTRARYGSDLWNHAINQLSKFPLSLRPVNKMVGLLTGFNQEQLYNQVFDSLQRQWTLEDESFDHHPEPLTRPGKVFTSYRYNHFLPGGEILTLKESYNQIPRFVKITPSGEEQTVVVPGQLFDESVGYRDELLVWSEYIPDPRWSHSGQSFLRVYNIKEMKLTTIKPEYKCFAPSISPDKHNVAVVETDFSNRYHLSVYQADGGGLVVRYPIPGNRYLFNPVWEDGRRVLAFWLTGEGKQLVRIDPYRGEVEELGFLPPGEYRQMTLSGRKLWFISGQSGRNELWSADLETGAWGRESRARFGMDCPAVAADGSAVVVSDYTADGYRLVRPLLPGREPGETVPREAYPLADRMADQEPGVVDFTNVDTTGYISKPYRKGLHLFNLHSWAPVALDARNMEVAPGISLSSQNVLGTAETTAGYKWNTSERTGLYYLRFEYRGWYPVVSAEVTSGRRSSRYGEITEYRDPGGEVLFRDTLFRRYTWREMRGELDVRVPLQLTRGPWYRTLQPELLYTATRYTHESSTPANFISGTLQSVAYRFYAHQLMRTSVRDIQSRWGWAADISYRHSPGSAPSMGPMTALQVKGYFPGVAAGHGFSLRGGWQERQPGEYSYGDVVALPWGWPAMQSRTLASGSARYVMPLFLPDWRLSKWVYIRRVRSAFFYDRARLVGDLTREGVVTGHYAKTLSSAGMELIADGNLLRFYAPASAGIRAAWLPEAADLRMELLFSVDFTSF